MKKRLRDYYKHLAVTDSFSLERQIPLVFFLSGLFLSSAAFIGNMAIGMPFRLNWPSLVTAIMCAVLPLALPEKINVILRIVIFYVGFLYFPYVFFMTDGINGSMPMYFILMTFYLSVIYKGKKRLKILALLVVYYLAVFIFSHFHPELLVPYADKQARIVDFCIALVMTCAICGGLAIMTLNIYDRVHRRASALMKMLKKRNRELLALSSHDELTGIHNRRYFMEYLIREIDFHKRNNMPLCLLMIDLDLFKNINDTYGHSMGDEVLKLMVESVKNHLRKHDLFCRHGGEEFVVMLPGCSAEDGTRVAERMREDIEKLRCRRGISFTVSIGVSWLEGNDTAEDLINKADTNLYSAKNNGRNRVCCLPATEPG